MSRPAFLSLFSILLTYAIGCGGDAPTEAGIDPADRPDARLTLQASADTINALGDTVRLTAMLSDSLGEAEVDPTRLDWLSLEPEVLSVEAGIAVSLGAGTGRVVAVCERCRPAEDTAVVHVRQVPAELALEPRETTLDLGDTLRFAAAVVDSNGAPLEGADGFEWSSSDPDVVSVSETGLVAGTSAGEADVSARALGVRGIGRVTVESSASPPPAGRRAAFPGAEGHGALALDGCDRRNLETLFVTRLSDSGSGSLRDAIGRADPNRLSVIVFRTGGTIRLSSPLSVERGCLYIAGQTAPGDGIQIDGRPGLIMKLPRDGSPRDIVVRYLRLRSGRGAGGTADVVSIISGERIVFDHVSTQWGNDEGFTIHTVQHDAGGKPATDITIQRSIMAEGLRPHSTGSLIVYRPDRAPPIERVSVHHNLYAHNAHRNPRIGASRSVEVVNNVVYNWRNRAGGMHDGATIDYVGNYFKAGPWTGTTTRLLEHYPGELSRLYMSGNIAVPLQPDPAGDQRRLVKYDRREDHRSLPSSAFRSGPLAAPDVPIEVQGAEQALGSVLDDVGANRRLDCDGGWVDVQDRVDRDIVRDVRDGTGPASDDEADHESDYGGMPGLASGSACPDADEDGMPDAFERRYGLDPSRAADAARDPDGDGYTSLEEYLNGTDPR